MKKIVLTATLFFFVLSFNSQAGEIIFHPIEHASFIIEYGELVIYVDPVGDKDLYSKFNSPDIILITHAHGDHLSIPLLKTFPPDTPLFGPDEVIEKTGAGTTMKNGDSKEIKGIIIDAVAMYNTTKKRLKFHPEGAGNGYVLTINKKRIYISGDTEDIPEMRSLKNIDYAFVCMNLPYTMDIEQAASAVLAFKPGIVYPYHYRGKPDMSDIEAFKKIVSQQDKDIHIVFLDWYKK